MTRHGLSTHVQSPGTSGSTLRRRLPWLASRTPQRTQHTLLRGGLGCAPTQPAVDLQPSPGSAIQRPLQCSLIGFVWKAARAAGGGHGGAGGGGGTHHEDAGHRARVPLLKRDRREDDGPQQAGHDQQRGRPEQRDVLVRGRLVQRRQEEVRRPRLHLAVHDDEDGEEGAGELGVPAQAGDLVPQEERQRHLKPGVSAAAAGVRTAAREEVRRSSVRIARPMVLRTSRPRQRIRRDSARGVGGRVAGG